MTTILCSCSCMKKIETMNLFCMRYNFLLIGLFKKKSEYLSIKWEEFSMGKSFVNDVHQKLEISDPFLSLIVHLVVSQSFLKVKHHLCTTPLCIEVSHRFTPLQKFDIIYKRPLKLKKPQKKLHGRQFLCKWESRTFLLCCAWYFIINLCCCGDTVESCLQKYPWKTSLNIIKTCLIFFLIRVFFVVCFFFCE